jgi:hypothetical protein
MIRFRRAVLAMISLNLAAPLPGRAEPLRLPLTLQLGLTQLASAGEKLARAKAAAAALAAHERPPGSPREWEGLPEAFALAARTLQAADGPAAPEVMGIPLEQLRACGSRGEASSRAERVVRQLLAAAQRVGETRALLKEHRAAAQTHQEDWRALVKALGALAADPLSANTLPSRWEAPDAGVLPALGTVEQALGRHDEKLERAQSELRARSAALAATLTDLSHAQDCLVAGHWAGAFTSAGATRGMTLELRSSGEGFTGTANLGGGPMPLRSVSLKASSLSIVLEKGGGTLTGTLSADWRTWSGSLSSIDGPGTFSLHRQ